MSSRIRTSLVALVSACLLIGVLASAAQAARPAWAPVAITAPTVLPPQQSEVQNIWIDAEAGTYTLTFSSQTTGPLAFDAPASTIEAALNGLSSIGGAGGSVEVSEATGEEGTYVVVFGGSLASTDVSQMTADSSGLSGGETHSAAVSTSLQGGPGTTELMLMVQNIGGFESVGDISYKATLPEGVTNVGSFGGGSFLEGWTCTTPVEAGHVVITCTFSKFAFFGPATVGPGRTPSSSVNGTITAAPGSHSGTIHVEVSGAGAEPAETDLPLTISSAPAKPGLQVLQAGAYDSNGRLDTRAGAHPYSASARLYGNTVRNIRGSIGPAGQFKDIVGELPPGFLGNPSATPVCPETLEPEDCSLDTVVGNVQPMLARGDEGHSFPLVNTVAPYGYPGKFRFNVFGLEPLNAVGQLRSFDDYGLNVGSLNTPQLSPVFGTFFTFWGAPADSSHDSTRCHRFEINATECGPSDVPNTAFLTNAVNCAEQAAVQPVTRFHTTTWQGGEATGSIDIPAVTECNKLHFEADFKFEPSDTKADSTASFRTELTVPTEGLTDPTKRTTPEIKESVVKLPDGVVLNASGADGLQACSLEQIGYLGNSFPMPNPIHFNAEPNHCPEASKIGTGELKSALLEDPLHGALYLAAQGNGNPYGSLFAIYLVIEDPRHGIFIKLPGRVDSDTKTGQLTVVFQNLPQLPFTSLKLDLKGGDRSALASPTTCGTYVTTATNTPWSAPESGPPTVSSNSFEINQGPNGLPCAPTPQDRPFNVALTAGTDSAGAGAHSPLSFRITRPDGSQELDTLELGTAPGLSATLKGIPQCTASNAAIEAKTGKQEEADPSCPAASRIGRLLTGAGAGPTPFYTSGTVYLAGPYKGAPLSVVAITPAVAGPFDLGNVVVRTALYIDRHTAVVSAKTDPIPQILEGVPLRIRDVRVILDRNDFSLNPTSCDPGAITARATGNSGAVADLSTRFQVGGCDKLGFKPSLKAHLTGGTKRGKHPAFTAEVNFPEGQANTKDVQVTIPHSEFLDQAHINTICTRVQAAAHECPAGSIYGFAEAETPLLDGKLTGPVFLKSSDHQLPDLAIALRGPDSQPVEVEFQGRIDSIKGQIRNTIEGLPDVPVSKFVLRMKGGRKGLLVNSRNLCAAKVTRMTVDMVAQNNKTSESRPPLKRRCKGAGKHKHKRHGRHGRRARR